MKAITRTTAAQAYRALFSFMLDHGEYFVSEDGASCRIAPGRETIIVHINRPLDDLDQLVNLSPLGGGAMEYYREQLVEGKHIKKENPEEEAEYTYYQRLREYDVPSSGIAGYIRIYDQIEEIIKKFDLDPETRRAVAITWQPWNDAESRDPPCLNHIKLNIWKDHLNMTCLFRSHDLVGGWIPNVYALIHLLNTVAADIGVYPGWLEVISEDGHFYKNDQDKIQKIKVKLGVGE